MPRRHVFGAPFFTIRVRAVAQGAEAPHASPRRRSETMSQQHYSESAIATRRPTRVRTLIIAAALATVAASLAAQTSPASAPQPTVSFTPGEGGKITGYILSRRGDDMLVRDETTRQIGLVTITPST